MATYDELVRTPDEVLPTLAGRREPLVLDVRVMPERRGGSRQG